MWFSLAATLVRKFSLNNATKALAVCSERSREEQVDTPSSDIGDKKVLTKSLACTQINHEWTEFRR